MMRRFTHRDPPGGRHDNDHSDICKIKILPTFKEISSIHAEYLPVQDHRQWHLHGMAGLVDRNFRLLREDTVGQLRNVIRTELQQGTRKPQAKNPQTKTSQVKAHIYKQITIQTIDLNRFSGMRFLVRFPQPLNIRGSAPKARKDWWDMSRRLKPGALVCLFDRAGLAVFCTVNSADQSNTPQSKSKLFPSLSQNHQYASVALELAEPTEENWKFILKYRTTHAERTQRPSSISLVEFPGVLLQSFQHTLLALQQRQLSLQWAFEEPLSEILAPRFVNPQSQMIKIPPPDYSTVEDFSFDLNCLMNGDYEMIVSHSQPADIAKLHKHSNLDYAQAEALVKSLQRKMALIQGPPGTGKSYTGVALIRTLLANKAKVPKFGPIICVCYTNHALDQLLEDLLDSEATRKIIRIGSQSKSGRMEQFNLRIRTRNIQKTYQERKEAANLNNQFTNHEQVFEQIRINDCGTDAGLKYYLEQEIPYRYRELFQAEQHGFYGQARQDPGQVIRAWLNGGDASVNTVRSFDELDSVHVDEMTRKERKNLHENWIKDHKDYTNERARANLVGHAETKEAWGKHRDELDLRCLVDADVVGLTTSGFAHHLNMLRRLESRVLLCEEAGEILEAHLLTSMLPSLQHVILIGDHQQLRPQVNNYNLSRDSPEGQSYALDRSLFERLVAPGGNGVRIPFSTLRTQRRMDPSISRLVRDTIHPQLQDAPLVLGYPKVTGMQKRLFWFDHRHPESGTIDYNPTSTSNWNEKEIELTVALVRHLLNQGVYKSGDIAVLTPYLGQLHRLRQRLASVSTITLGEDDEQELEDAGFSDGENGTQKEKASKATLLQTLRVATIDNFQGEEAKIVVISLVRSNLQNRCGFLRVSNRINVLLSRAQHGMYIIGNTQTYRAVSMWQKIIKILEQEGNIGSHFELSCSRHPDTPIPVKDPKEFLELSPEGGCTSPCGLRLSCGHPCKQKCHSEMLHEAAHCSDTCTRPLKGCMHPCPNPCGDACPEKCMVLVRDPERSLPCGHKSPGDLPCWQAQDLTLVECTELVDKQISHCNHIINVPCNVDPDGYELQCKEVCRAVLPCGHECKDPCSQCITKTPNGHQITHGKCKQKCGRNYTACSHSCVADCHGEAACPPCAAPCEVQCGHSKCPRKCHEPCTLCAVSECLSSCPHSTCSMPCAAPCDHIPCSRRCEKRLGCGHQCPSVCGEICPSQEFCQICGTEVIKESIVDFIEMKTYREIDLTESPCIFPPCGHFLTVESMDGQMDIKSHYDLEESGKPISISSSSRPFSAGDIQTCASCRGSLRSLSRYGRLVRRAMLDEGMKRLISYLNQEYVPLAQELPRVLTALQNRGHHTSAAADVFRTGVSVRIEGSPSRQVSVMSSLVNKRQAPRWKDILALRQRITRYRDMVALEEQPINQVRAFVEDARRRKRTSGQFSFDEGILQMKGSIQAASLLLRLDMALLGDFFAMKKSIPVVLDRNDLAINLDESRAECRRLVDDATTTHRILQQVEGHIFLAQLCALELQFAKEALSFTLREEGLSAIKTAGKLCKRYPEQTRGLQQEVDGTTFMLRGASFYTPVTNEERLAVLGAMTGELLGTGHWYYCANGHPFTIGECGGAMEVARCPECGSPVGGQDHLTVHGVHRADDLEEHLLRINP